MRRDARFPREASRLSAAHYAHVLPLPERERAIDALGTGDILEVAATGSMIDGIHVIERIDARGVLIKVLDKPHLDLTTPLGRGFIAFLSAMAE